MNGVFPELFGKCDVTSCISVYMKCLKESESAFTQLTITFHSMDETQFSQESLQWFAMRDLKRRHAKLPAYKLFENLKVRYFTPMVHRLVVVNGKRVDQEVPFMQDLLL